MVALTPDGLRQAVAAALRAGRFDAVEDLLTLSLIHISEPTRPY